jgi:hypothetical protein
MVTTPITAEVLRSQKIGFIDSYLLRVDQTPKAVALGWKACGIVAGYESRCLDRL